MGTRSGSVGKSKVSYRGGSAARGFSVGLDHGSMLGEIRGGKVSHVQRLDLGEGCKGKGGIYEKEERKDKGGFRLWGEKNRSRLRR